MGFMMEISPKYCSIKAKTTAKTTSFNFLSARQAQKTLKNLKYIQLSTSLSLKFNTCLSPI